MVTDQVWEAPISPPRDEVVQMDAAGQPVLVDGHPVVLTPARPGLRKAEIILFDHPVRHTKGDAPPAHARRIVETTDGQRLKEIYLNRSYLIRQVQGTYDGTHGRVWLADSAGTMLQDLLLDHVGPFTLVGHALTLATGFSVTLEHLDPATWAEGLISVAFRQEETVVSEVAHG